MNIMYILHESGSSFNGASRSVLSLIQDSSLKSDNIFVILPKKEGRIVNELEKIENVTIVESKFYRWKVKREKCVLRNLYNFIRYHFVEKRVNYAEAKILAELAVKESIDIIHTNSSVVNIGGLLHELTGIPHIWHVREFGEEDFDIYPLESSEKTYEFMCRNSNRIVCISYAIANKYKKYISSDCIEVIHNGIDMSDYSFSDSEKDNNLLISGMISRKKGQYLAVEALDVLRKQGNDIKLYVAGKGNLLQLGDNYEANKEHIDLLGFVDDMNLVRKNIGIELMCSVSEGFGRTIVEAMSSGLIIVAANGGATPEIVDDGVNGFLFEKNNIDSLVHTINKVLSLSEKDKVKIRNNALYTVQNKFTKDLYVSNVRRIYNELINK